MPEQSTGNVEAGESINARDIITGIQQHFTLIFPFPFEPPPDLKVLKSHYLTCLRDRYSILDVKGLVQGPRAAPMPLSAVYVPLKARPQRPDAGELQARVAGRLLHTGGDMAESLAEMVPSGRSATPVLVEKALKTEPAVVVLGDPGAGKSTLLKVIALALAEQPAGPLPILLPLNAYARHLQNGGTSNLCDFLGEHYGLLRKSLERVGTLFEEALKAGQAVILLDGLDEVQANRFYLTGLVQEFVSEWVLKPSETDEPVGGNRVVVTSRIVGYEEAPLTGDRWRTYTLTDFDRGDIKRFVTQWTRAFETDIRGETDEALQKAESECNELLKAIFARPSVERLAANPLLLTILALIKRTGVLLPEQRVKLYELYLEALIESWNIARSLDDHPAGPPMKYLDTVQILAPLALWLRETSLSAGLIVRSDLENWLADYYKQEWGYSPGEARQRGREFLDAVQRHSNLLIERGEGQYGFLHLTLEEMLAAKGIAQIAGEEGIEAAASLMNRHLTDPTWRETLLLAVGVIGVVQQWPAVAGKLLLALLDSKAEGCPAGTHVVLAGEALLDAGESGVGRSAAFRVIETLVKTMQSPDCHIRERRDAGALLGRLGWRPEPEPDDRVLAPEDSPEPPSGLDAFRPVDKVWMGKYPVTNAQFDRFMRAGGYDERRWWTGEGWDWRTGRYDSKAPDYLKDWLSKRPPAERNRPFWWSDRRWNSPLQPVVGVSWFEALAYCAWLEASVREWSGEKMQTLPGRWAVRLPAETEWEKGMGGQGDYPWGDRFDPVCLNCADAWAGQDLSSIDEWRKWIGSESFQEAGTTAVTTFPQGRSGFGLWDGAGNVWEWMAEPYERGGAAIALRGGSWGNFRMSARVSSRDNDVPVDFDYIIGFRLVVVPI